MSSPQVLIQRTEAVHRELKSLRWRFRFSAWLTLIVGGLLLLVMIGYFSYGYSEVSALKDPDLIVSLAGDMVEQQIPPQRRLLEEQVQQNAGTWAQQASDQLLDLIPPGREQLEQAALRQSDELIAKIDVLGEKEFRRILNENRETVDKAIVQLKNDEEISEEFVEGLKDIIEKESQIDADNQAEALATMVGDLNRNMAQILKGENLSREQRAERRVLMLAKRIHHDRFGGVTLDDLELPGVEGLAEAAEKDEKDRIRKEREEIARETTETTAAGQDETPAAVDEPDEEQDEATTEEEAAATEETPAEEASAEETGADESDATAEVADAPAEEAADESADAEPAVEEPTEE